MSGNAQAADVFQHLRRFVRARAGSTEQCELCGAQIGERHHHLLDLKSRKSICSCEACAILFIDRAARNYRRIPMDIESLAAFALTDVQWEELSIPINIAFFCRTGDAAEPSAFYPSPAGATRAHLDLHSWRQIVEDNPALQRMEADVQALLVNRVTHPHEYYIVPIDECYRLTGLIRSEWRGFSGGKDVWRSIGEFFANLKRRAIRATGVTHA
jgi:hypothetical protein